MTGMKEDDGKMTENEREVVSVKDEACSVQTEN